MGGGRRRAAVALLVALGSAFESGPGVVVERRLACRGRVVERHRLVRRPASSQDDEEATELRARAAALREEVAALQAEAEAVAASKEDKAEPPPVVEKPKPQPAPAEKKVPDDWIEWPDRALACLPYLLPLSDVLPYGRYVLIEFPLLAVALVGPVAPFVAVINALPFGSLFLFLALTSQIRNLEIPRFTRFSIQQAVILDIALIFPNLFGELFGAFKLNPPEAVIEPASTTVFFACALSIVYSVVMNLRGQYPDGIPLVSEATDRSVGPF